MDAPDAPVCEIVQLKVAPVGTELNAIPVALPEQIACAAGVAVTVGLGLTVTVTVIGVPGHPLSVGVTV